MKTILVRSLVTAFCLLLFTAIAGKIVFRGCLPLLLEGELGFNDEVPYDLPENCAGVTQAQTGKNFQALEDQRKRRGLEFEGTIICKRPADLARMTENPDWLPSYVCCTWQYRRYIILTIPQIPMQTESPGESEAVAEICLMPRWRYMKQLAGDCEKFKIWL